MQTNPSSALPLKTPASIIELERLQRRRQKGTNPTDRALQNTFRGCKIATHNAVLYMEHLKVVEEIELDSGRGVCREESFCD
jgi:hypothetical protein